MCSMLVLQLLLFVIVTLLLSNSNEHIAPEILYARTLISNRISLVAFLLAWLFVRILDGVGCGL